MENKILFAPLEGITGEIFRRVFNRHFKGVSEYYTPFITPKMKVGIDKKDRKEIARERDEGMKLVPQILTGEVSGFILTAEKLLEYGYDEVNLNLGCPSGTVVNKGRGSGALKDLDKLDELLSGIFEYAEKRKMKVSIKSRLGFYSENEFPEIMDIFVKHPFYKLIIHPRTRKEFYQGEVHKEKFRYAMDILGDRKDRLSFNGDINSLFDFQRIKEEFPEIFEIMIGRGFLRNPFLIEEIVGLGVDEDNSLKKIRLKAYLDELFLEHKEDAKDERIAMLKLKEIWAYLGSSFKEAEPYLKEIRKAKNTAEYKASMNVLFSNCDFRP